MSETLHQKRARPASQCFLFPPSPILIPSIQAQQPPKEELLEAKRVPPPPSISEQYKIMTFNIRFDYEGDGRNRWKFRSKGVCQQLAEYHVDILCLQEALRYQFDDIFDCLNRNGLSYDAVTRGREKNDRSDGPEPNEHCSILFNNKKFTKIDSGFFWLSDTPDVPGSKSWDADCVRIATWIVLVSKDYTGGMSPLLVVNTHWDHMGHTARMESAKLIKRRIIDISNRVPVPIRTTIFTGDLNCLSNSSEFHEMLRRESDELGGVQITFKNAKDLSHAECNFLNDHSSCDNLATFTGWHDECEIIIDYVLISDHHRSLPHVHYEVLTDDLPLEPFPTHHNGCHENGENGFVNPVEQQNIPDICVTPSGSDNESPLTPMFEPKKMRNLTHSPQPIDEEHSPFPTKFTVKQRRMSLPPVTSFSNLEEAEQFGYTTFSRKKKGLARRKLSDHRPILVTISI